MPLPLAAIAALLFGIALTPFAQTPAVGTPVAEPAIAPLVWRLQRIELPDGASRAPKDPAHYTVQFLPDGELAVLADCNRGRGSWVMDGAVLTLGPIATTRIACGPDSLDQEFLSRLQRANGWSYRDDGDLILTSSADAAVLVFAPELLGIVWSWQHFLGGNDATVTPTDPTQYEVVFRSKGRLAVRADCARGKGSWQIDGSAIDLSIREVAPETCGSASLRDRFISDLNEASSFVVRDGMLHLALPMDAGILSFAARIAPDNATPTPTTDA
ncbi:MAG: META domain-containing protein [Thermomicrobiales bacterium]|nr:META domain-containing protein [Thermomicrobiales bacterium]